MFLAYLFLLSANVACLGLLFWKRAIHRDSPPGARGGPCHCPLLPQPKSAPQAAAFVLPNGPLLRVENGAVSR